MIDYDQLSADYARHRNVHPHVFLDIIARSGINQASQVLEVGCGTGNYIREIERALSCACWGLDPSMGMIIKAREMPSKIRYIQGKAEDPAFKDRSFDLVFSVDVVHHVADKKKAFNQAFRILKSGGWICTVTDSEWIIRHRRPLTAYFPETEKVELQRYPPISDLAAWMVACGFDDIAAWTVEFPFMLDDIQPYQNKAYSALHLISPSAFERGIELMEEDLKMGPIPCISYYLLLWGRKR